MVTICPYRIHQNPMGVLNFVNKSYGGENIGKKKNDIGYKILNFVVSWIVIFGMLFYVAFLMNNGMPSNSIIATNIVASTIGACIIVIVYYASE